MTEDPLINLEVRFLLARYGRERLLKAIAQVGKVEFSELVSALETYESRDRVSRKRKTENSADLVAKLNLGDDIKPLVQKLGLDFEVGSFLPQLREVRRFLASCGIKATVKSRREALPKVIEALGNCGIERLHELNDKTGDSRRGDLGLIADQILGEKKH